MLFAQYAYRRRSEDAAPRSFVCSGNSTTRKLLPPTMYIYATCNYVHIEEEHQSVSCTFLEGNLKMHKFHRHCKPIHIVQEER